MILTITNAHMRYRGLNDDGSINPDQVVVKNPRRELIIEKHAQDDDSVLIEGAKFEMYGPFDPDEATGATGDKITFTEVKNDAGEVISYKVDPEGTVTELVTNAAGQIYVTGLAWDKEYVVKEISGGAGYNVEGATAEANNTYTVVEDLGNGVFIVKAPTEERPTTDATDEVLVKDPRTVPVVLEVQKILNSYATEDITFEFTLELTGIEDEALEELEPNKTNLAAGHLTPDPLQITVHGGSTGQGSETGSFDPVILNGVGTFTFTITELEPDPLPPGWDYDPEWERTVTVVTSKGATVNSGDLLITLG